MNYLVSCRHKERARKQAVMENKEYLRDRIINYLKVKNLFNSVLPLVELLIALYGIFFFCIFHLFPLKKNKIVFSSFYGLQYNGGPKMISDQLLGKGYDVVWALPHSMIVSEKIRKVRYHTVRYYYEMATATVWVDNCRKDYWLKRRKGQLYIQTWHGPVCIKAVEKDAEETIGKRYLRNAKYDSKIANYIVAESEWRKQNIISSFWYDGSIIEAEFKQPHNPNIGNEVRNFYGIPLTWKMLVYVPTFRNSKSVAAYFNDYGVLLEKLKQKTESEWCVIVRMHPNVSDTAKQIQYGSRVFNGTLYCSADDLISASDCVMTDYSGCIFDGFKAKKIVLLFARDYESYMKEERRLYFDLNKLPAPMAKTEEELYKIIDDFDPEVYEMKREQFVNTLGYYASDAAEVCAGIIMRHLDDFASE